MKSATLVDRARDSRTSNHTMLSSGFFSHNVHQFIINLTVPSWILYCPIHEFWILCCSIQGTWLFHPEIQDTSLSHPEIQLPPGFCFPFADKSKPRQSPAHKTSTEFPASVTMFCLSLWFADSHFYCSMDTLPHVGLSHSLSELS